MPKTTTAHLIGQIGFGLALAPALNGFLWAAYKLVRHSPQSLDYGEWLWFTFGCCALIGGFGFLADRHARRGTAGGNAGGI